MAFPWEFSARDFFEESRVKARATLTGKELENRLRNIDSHEASQKKKKRALRSRSKKAYTVVGHPTWYPDYLKTNHWRRFKERYRQSGRPRQCIACGEGRYELHHITYERIGNESLDDVVALCRAHHLRAHAREKKGAPLRTAHLEDIPVTADQGV